MRILSTIKNKALRFSNTTYSWMRVEEAYLQHVYENVYYKHWHGKSILGKCFGAFIYFPVHVAGVLLATVYQWAFWALGLGHVKNPFYEKIAPLAMPFVGGTRQALGRMPQLQVRGIQFYFGADIIDMTETEISDDGLLALGVSAMNALWYQRGWIRIYTAIPLGLFMPLLTAAFCLRLCLQLATAGAFLLFNYLYSHFLQLWSQAINQIIPHAKTIVGFFQNDTYWKNEAKHSWTFYIVLVLLFAAMVAVQYFFFTGLVALMLQSVLSLQVIALVASAWCGIKLFLMLAKKWVNWWHKTPWLAHYMVKFNDVKCLIYLNKETLHGAALNRMNRAALHFGRRESLSMRALWVDVLHHDVPFMISSLEKIVELVTALIAFSFGIYGLLQVPQLGFSILRAGLLTCFFYQPLKHFVFSIFSEMGLGLSQMLSKVRARINSVIGSVESLMMTSETEKQNRQYFSQQISEISREEKSIQETKQGFLMAMFSYRIDTISFFVSSIFFAFVQGYVFELAVMNVLTMVGCSVVIYMYYWVVWAIDEWMNFSTGEFVLPARNVVDAQKVYDESQKLKFHKVQFEKDHSGDCFMELDRDVRQNGLNYKKKQYTFAWNKLHIITGKNGAGKSTFLEIISGWATYLADELTDASVKIGGIASKEHVFSLSQRPLLLGETLYSYIFDDNTVEDAVEKRFINWGEKFGLFDQDQALNTSWQAKTMHELSGGLKQKAAFLRMLYLLTTKLNEKGDQGNLLFLLDESFAEVDNRVVLMLDCLMNLCKKHGRKFVALTVSHHKLDRFYVKDHEDKVAFWQINPSDNQDVVLKVGRYAHGAA